MKLFVMYIGLEKDAKGEPIRREEIELGVTLLKHELASRFGGYSVGEVNGGYLHHNHDLAEEKALRVEVTASEEQSGHIREVAAMFRDMFRQESVLLNCTTVESSFV